MTNKIVSDSVILDTDSEDELPAGWEERVTLDGKVYYASHLSKGTQWVHPVSKKKKRVSGELPYGWERATNAENQIYFIDHINKKTTFTDPRLAFAYEEKKDGSGGIHGPKYDASSTAMQVVQDRDLTGQYAIITGANSGLGFETARTLAWHGAHVVLACKNATSADEAVGKILAERPKSNVKAMNLDLTSLKNVQKFAKDYTENKWPLHILVLNAGVFAHPFELTTDGYETTFQANFLGHFHLAQLLQPVLISSAPARIVVVCAESHRFTDLKFDTLSETHLSPPQEYYRPILAYNQSKLCCVLMSKELNSRLRHYGITSNAVHPGNVISTGLPRHGWLWWLVFQMVRPFTKNKQQGSSTIMYCAVSRELEGVGGMYYNNCMQCPPSPEAMRDDTATKLWTLSEQLVTKAQSLQPSYPQR